MLPPLAIGTPALLIEMNQVKTKQHLATAASDPYSLTFSLASPCLTDQEIQLTVVHQSSDIRQDAAFWPVQVLTTPLPQQKLIPSFAWG